MCFFLWNSNFCSIFAQSINNMIRIGMARGRQICRILKEIRRRIAEANGLEYATSECRYKGDCMGTCPKCESEMRWLERQLHARVLAGKTVALAGISAGLLAAGGGVSSAACPSELDLGVKPVASDSVDSLESQRLMAVQEAVICGGVEENPLFEYDKQAEFPGGVDALIAFLKENTVYPEKAVADGIQGRVIVKFIVNEAGRVTDEAIVKSVHTLLDEEALRVVRKLPRFIPAEYKGKHKASYFALPVNFSLDEKRDSVGSVPGDE